MARKFYITTPLYYVNDKPHVGHGYTTVAADCAARFHRMIGDEVMFLTGTDEHGQKIAAAAAEAGMEPRAFADKVVVSFRDLWKRLNISYDQFIRTTEQRHYKVVQEIFRRIYNKGDIYLGEYEGLYCTACERFYKESQLVDGKCPDHNLTPQLLKEKSYFFRLSGYQQPLIEHYRKNPEFVRPDFRYNEMMSRLEQGLEDLSISRSNLTWGIPVPIDSGHVIYVWFDALINYVTAAGFLEDEAAFAKWWPADIHMMAKDILWFHSVIWPAILLAADIELPRQVFAHGFWNFGDAKMSKTMGNVVDPVALTNEYGVDALRYFLLREVPFGLDGKFSIEALIGRINSDLANDLGNLLHRSLPMIERFSNSEVPPPSREEPVDLEIKTLFLQTSNKALEMLQRFEYSQALVEIFNAIKRMNKYIDESAPWVLSREGKTQRLETVLYNLAESLRVIGVMVYPFMPDTGLSILKQIGIEDPERELVWSRTRLWGEIRPGARIHKLPPLFPRIEIKEAPVEEKKAPEKKVKKETEAKKMEETSMIDIEEFRKADLRVGVIKEAEKVEGAEKLVKLLVDIGEENPRTVVAGIAKAYSAPDLVGKRVILVANLKPAKLRGIMSQGMLLAAVDGENLSLVTTDKEVSNGTRIS